MTKLKNRQGSRVGQATLQSIPLPATSPQCKLQLRYYYNGTRATRFMVTVVEDYGNSTVYSTIYSTIQARTLVSGVADWNTLQMGLGARQNSMLIIIVINLRESNMFFKIRTKFRVSPFSEF